MGHRYSMQVILDEDYVEEFMQRELKLAIALVREFDDDEELVKALKVVHNYFSPPSKHIDVS